MAHPVLNEQLLEFGALFVGDMNSITGDLFVGAMFNLHSILSMNKNNCII